ncbi:helix-turn-helix domain-containing protein [Paenarthrobacter sp. OM7]|uniref:helix-turn-helix domain-containing protein n=1 Tax=Paenarthrobacter sp. OM7 TaxID=3041264 RepID=UPI0024689546|nr:helix-turn-helix domain-containing protein [Paenarthrobacter sp. OM7]WGM21830.1 helix-turn-helix domain-containing protein [Paenarthrobacter sp. OM7]
MSTSTETLPSSALPLHTVADAAKQLGVSLNFLYERIRGNEIPTVNLGTDSQKKLRIATTASAPGLRPVLLG